MKNNVHYFLYVRKSTDTEDKQVQSLTDQIDVMKRKAKDLGIQIIDTYIESRSAKAPGREEFNKMIGKIYEGKAKGIITWKLDRLSRNPIDTGTIQYMLQTGILDQIITNDRIYNPVDAGLLMSVETGMANQYILDLSTNVKRGMTSKTAKGGFCGMAPEGYLNDKGNKTIIKDEKNFPIIKKAWSYLLEGYTIPKIVDIINYDFAYKSNKKGRDKLTIGGLYGIFKNVFYTGNFIWKGKLVEGNYPHMITFEDFEKAQKILGQKWAKVRPKTLEFAYTGLIRCGECGCAIVGTQKTKKIITTGEYKDYIYYHCSKRKKDCICNQKRITINELETQINDLLDNVEIIPEFKEIGIEILKSNYKEEISMNIDAKNGIEKALKDSEKKLNKIIDLFIDEKIENDVYEKKKDEIQKEINLYRGRLNDLNIENDNSIEKVEEILSFILLAKETFNKGDLKMKKAILSSLGENFILLDSFLTLDIHSWLQPINNNLPGIKRIYGGLEPFKKGISSLRTDAKSSFIVKWSEGPGLNWHTQGLKP